MNDKNKTGQDANKNRSEGTSINRQDEQQAQQARDRDDRSGQQGGQAKKPSQDQGRH